MVGVMRPLALACFLLAGPAPAWACEQADDLYHKGWYPEYVAKLEELANAGSVECSFTLGTVYRDGVLTTQDYDKALARYKFAADKGYAFAQFELGSMYDNGMGVPQDQAEAARWYQKAADQNFGMAQYNLGVLYNEGLGVAKDTTKAEALFAASRKNGSAEP